MGKIIGLGCAGIVALVLVFGAIAGATVWGSYNSMNGQQQAVNQGWSQVENVYQRRYDLIPNLVNTVQGAANFEKSTFIEIAQARASVGQMKISAAQAPQTAEQLKQFQEAQGQLGSALSRLMMVTENYPELKANQNFLDLQAQIEGTENRISVERRNFTVAVQTYNTTISSLPAKLWASTFGFQPRPYFEATEAAQNAPVVNFKQ